MSVHLLSAPFQLPPAKIVRKPSVGLICADHLMISPFFFLKLYMIRNPWMEDSRV